MKTFDEVIRELKEKQLDKIAIYPYGKVGKQIEHLLKNEYGISDVVLFDKKPSGINVVNPERIIDYSDYYFIVATKNRKIKKEIIENLLSTGVMSSHIIGFDCNCVCVDDRKNRDVDYELIRSVADVRKKIKPEVIAPKEVSHVDTQLIVSLTSFPARIAFVVPTIKSLLNQSLSPSKIIMWLAREEFPNGKEMLPSDLLELENEMFEIKWCENLRSYKKLVPTLREYPNSIIATADDDLIYEREWLEKLYVTHKKYPTDIICHRITKIIKDQNGKWANIPGGWDYYSGGCYLNKLTGCSGVLYPVGSLADDVTNSNIFMQLAPTSDDIWFWLMGILNDTKVRVAENSNVELNENKEMSTTPSLTSVNDSGEKLFWEHFYNILSLYPELIDKLENEYISRCGENWDIFLP